MNILFERIKEFFIGPALERFYMVFGGHIHFQILHSAVKFDLFTLLDEDPNLSLEEISEKLGLERKPARIMLLGLTATKLLKKRGNIFKNTEVARKLLSKKSPHNIISYVLLEHEAVYKAMFHLHESLVKNTNSGLKEIEGTESTFYERMVHNPKLTKIFQDAMEELSKKTNLFLSKYLDLSRVHHLLDVGGGNGTNIMTLAKANPHLKATVFDLPEVCQIARGIIAQNGLEKRCHTFEGNCFQDNFPKNVDAMMFCHFFTMWSEKKDQMLLKKAYEALPVGGQVILFNMMQKNDGTGPLTAAIGSPYFLALASGEGMLYTWKEYETWVKEAGFSKTRTIRLPLDHGIIVGLKSP